MNSSIDFQEFKQFIAGKKVAVIGVGISNRPLIKLLAELKAKVTAFDQRGADDPALSSYRAELAESGLAISWSLGTDYLQNLQGFDLIFRTPILRPDEEHIRSELERGAILTSEMEIFMTYCPAPIIGVTGSDGKSTTSTLIAELLRAQGYRVFLGGNIGRPLLSDIEQISSEDRVVLELSSFQLLTASVSPKIAVVTNITPNHLNVHRDMAEYVTAKEQLLAHQKITDKSVLFADDAYFKQFVSKSKGERIIFANHPIEYAGLSFYMEDGKLWRQRGSERSLLIDRSDLLLPGDYNVLNFLAACAAVDGDVDIPAIEQVATTFSGVAHRVELVREVDGVKYYNSSIDSSPNRSIATLSVFREKTGNNILIMGGQDKKCDYSQLGSAIAATSRQVILCGQNSDLIENCLEGKDVEIQRVNNYEEALEIARQWAKPGDRVVLTPAGTSFDRYLNFEQRGEDFRALVQRL